MTRIGADIFDGPRWVATRLHSRWYRLVEGDLTPLEPNDPRDAGRIVELDAAKSPAPARRDLVGEAAREKTRVIDRILSKNALKRIRWVP